MKITIIDGSLQDYIEANDNGAISVFEPCIDKTREIADKFLDYGKTVVLEPYQEGE